MPKIQYRDNAGNYPKVGDYVAYNYSGQVASGWITRMSGATITIHQHHPNEGHISRVRGGTRCVLVLEAAE